MQAYNQIVVDKETTEMFTWSTHKELYAVNRLPLGCKPNSAIFQSIIDSVLLGCPGTVAFIDDIVITGKDHEEHLKNIESVLERLSKAGFKVNRSKCEFFKNKISYLGFVIDANGLHKSNEKVRAITEMPNPNDKTEIFPWPKSSRPFQRIHIDYCGPINGYNYLVVIDTYTKWLEVVKTRLITAERTVQMLQPIFSRFGIPSVMVSDNAPSFTSYKFKQFCQNNGIDQITSPAYHPASNGQAENSVKTFKFGFCKMIEDPKNSSRQTDDVLESFLYMNRNAVHIVKQGRLLLS